MNPLNFGKLFILNNGDIYANLNSTKIGIHGKDSISKVLYRELNKKNSWLQTRKNVEPCTNCVFDVLCPPISNYEYVLRKNNLCHIWKEKT